MPRSRGSGGRCKLVPFCLQELSDAVRFTAAESDVLTKHFDVKHEYVLMLSCTQGLRTYIATNQAPGGALRAEAEQHNETWAAYPDDQPLHSLALKVRSLPAANP